MTTKRKAFMPKLLATGALMSMLMSLSPLPVSAYTQEEAVEATALATEGYENNSLHRSKDGVTVSDGKLIYRLPSVANKSIYAYKQLSLSVNGRVLSDSALIINSTVYLPIRAYFNAIGGATMSYNSKSRTFTVSKNGLYMSATDGGYVVYANDRPIFSFSPTVLMSNGRMYMSATSLAKITGLTLTKTASSISLNGTYNPLKSAKEYYREDEVLWLARIIYAESGGESLIGQISVGDVILNRVKSPLFPNTIYGVIFDRKYGVQFSPILNGTIYNTPSYTATLAAKICLEGISLSDEALYFLNPKLAESNWIVKNREYAYTIGGHDFYK